MLSCIPNSSLEHGASNTNITGVISREYELIKIYTLNATQVTLDKDSCLYKCCCPLLF